MFVDGRTDYNGPARIMHSVAITKVKRPPVDLEKAAKVPSSSRQEESQAVEPPLPKPVPPPPRPFIVVQKPVPAREVIEVPSSEDQAEDQAEYEEVTRGNKRKLKSSGATRASKKRAPSDMEQDAKGGKKGVTQKLKAKGKDVAPSKVPPDAQEKGGPYSPLSVSSSTTDEPRELKTKTAGGESYETTCSHLSN